jgi:hypothetical protein
LQFIELPVNVSNDVLPLLQQNDPKSNANVTTAAFFLIALVVSP